MGTPRDFLVSLGTSNVAHSGLPATRGCLLPHFPLPHTFWARGAYTRPTACAMSQLLIGAKNTFPIRVPWVVCLFSCAFHPILVTPFDGMCPSPLVALYVCHTCLGPVQPQRRAVPCCETETLCTVCFRRPENALCHPFSPCCGGCETKVLCATCLGTPGNRRGLPVTPDRRGGCAARLGRAGAGLPSWPLPLHLRHRGLPGALVSARLSILPSVHPSVCPSFQVSL
jgi:hypothetical protein